MATESFAKMSDSLYDSDWHKLPIGLQKYFILMIANTQKPIYYHGFGVTILNLETFCQVIEIRIDYSELFIFCTYILNKNFLTVANKIILFTVSQDRLHLLYDIQNHHIRLEK